MTSNSESGGVAAKPADPERESSAGDDPEEQKTNVKRGPVADPDSPGYSALGLQDGDPVEPNEPA